MKTIFKVGQEVYDQVNFPYMKGKVKEITKDSMGFWYVVVIFDGYKFEVNYTLEGRMTQGITRILSTKPYKVEFQGFEQKAPEKTYEDAVKWLEKNSKDRVIYADEVYISEESENAFGALKKLVILREYYNEGWQPDWKSTEELKYYIKKYIDEFLIKNTHIFIYPLFFKSEKIALKFLEEQRELLEIAKPLL